jgi:hypothetical protein
MAARGSGAVPESSAAKGEVHRRQSRDPSGNRRETCATPCQPLITGLSPSERRSRPLVRPPTDPQRDAFSRFDVLRQCVFDALVKDTVGKVLDAACVVSLIACGLSPV